MVVTAQPADDRPADLEHVEGPVAAVNDLPPGGHQDRVGQVARPLGVHGVDERVPLDGLQFGVRVLDRFLRAC